MDTAAADRFLARCAEVEGPGAILDIQGPRHAIAYTRAAGVFERERPDPLRPEHSFRIASMSKTITAAVVLRLVEQGVLALDDRLVERLPPVADRVHPDITLRQLMNHTSGLWDFAMSDEWQQHVMGDPGRFFDPDAILDWALVHGRPVGEPGGRFVYSDTGYVLVGHVLQHVTGATLAALSRDLVLDPLALSDTWLEGHEPPRGPALSHAYHGEHDGLDIDGSFDWAAGGHVSTVRDLERLLRGIFEGGLFERPETLDQMLDMGPAEELGGYGLGVIEIEMGGHRTIGHRGYWGSFMLLLPEHSVTITGTVNRTGFDRVGELVAVVEALDL